MESVVYADSEVIDNEVSRMLVERMCFSGVLDALDSLSDDKPKSRDDKDIAQSVHLDEDSEQMIIILKEELIVGAFYRIGILYLAEINDGDNIGFFRVQKKQEDHITAAAKDGLDQPSWKLPMLVKYSLVSTNPHSKRPSS